MLEWEYLDPVLEEMFLGAFEDNENAYAEWKEQYPGYASMSYQDLYAALPDEVKAFIIGMDMTISQLVYGG